MIDSIISANNIEAVVIIVEMNSGRSLSGIHNLLKNFKLRLEIFIIATSEVSFDSIFKVT